MTVQILRQIRDEIVATRDHVGERIEQTNQCIDSMRGDLGGRIDETNQRVGKVEQALLDLAEQQRFVVRHLHALTSRDRRLEDDVGDLRTRVEAIEKKVSGS